MSFLIDRFKNSDFDEVANEKENESKLPHMNEEPINPSKNLRKKLNLNDTVYSDYGSCIKSLLIAKETEYDTSDCLANHRITEDQRSKMVDWIAEVIHIFNCSIETFFLAVKIMDRYFKLLKRTVGIEELHVIGAASIYIASKFQDIVPLTMNTLYSKVVHCILPTSYIKKVERDILHTLNYQLDFPTVLEFLYPHLIGQNDEFSKTAIVISELSQLSYELSSLKPSHLALAIYILARQVILKHEQIYIRGPVLEALNELKKFLIDYCFNCNEMVSILTNYNAKINLNTGKLLEFKDESFM
ncbi:unnamed protein product [Blepharisma stoltei]|uniref:Cyclin-like domain-containing protein n=1 Tax=Blepharisma stoltei TaxID=1481888 RepID=A0AAU9IIW3_9CILI|nr:unnamed protein product [Blepharisma stoltei]